MRSSVRERMLLGCISAAIDAAAGALSSWCAVKIAMLSGSCRYWNAVAFKERGRTASRSCTIRGTTPQIGWERFRRFIPSFILLSGTR